MPAYVQYEAGSEKINCLGSVIKVKNRKKRDGFAYLTTAMLSSSFDSLHLQEYFKMHLSNGMSVNAYKKKTMLSFFQENEI